MELKKTLKTHLAQKLSPVTSFAEIDPLTGFFVPDVTLAKLFYSQNVIISLRDSFRAPKNLKNSPRAKS